MKEPLKKLLDSGKVDIKSWKREAEIMLHISHVSTATGVPTFQRSYVSLY